MTAIDILCLDHRTIYKSGFSFDETSDMLVAFSWTIRNANRYMSEPFIHFYKK
ncbi:MAG: hypothetical protein HZR80_08135 [Candidatus Heimdallarchaeota archaeon]